MGESNSRDQKGPGGLRVSLGPEDCNNLTSIFLMTSVTTDLSPLDRSK